MTDIVERLRINIKIIQELHKPIWDYETLKNAADEIERLREENKRFLEALQCYDCDCKDDECESPFYDCGRVARDALKEEK